MKRSQHSKRFAKLSLKRLMPVLILLLGGLVAALILFMPAKNDQAAVLQNQDNQAASEQQAASSQPAPAQLAACANTSNFKCYERFLEDRTAQTDPVRAIADLRGIYETDAYAKSQCHQLTHVVGHAAFTKYKTLPAAYTKGDSFCWSGYYHGVTEQAIGQLGVEGVKAKANDICQELARSKPYSFDHYNCVHGLGHGFLTVANANLFEGLKTCDLLTNDWERSSCYGGIYMENIMVAERGGATEYLKPDQPLYPCTAVGEQYKYQCYLMQTSYALRQNDYNFAEAFVLCRDVADAAYATVCYQSIGRDASGHTVSDIARTKANCDTAPDKTGLENCMLGAARDFVSYYHSNVQARDLCKAFGKESEASCVNEVKSYYKTFR